MTPPSTDPYSRETYTPERYVPSDYELDGYSQEVYEPEGYGQGTFAPDAYPSAGYSTNGYRAGPYRDPHGEPRAEPRRGEQWGYDRERADPYPPAPAAPGGLAPGDLDNPLGLDRATAAPRPPLAPPPDYHRPLPDHSAPHRAPHTPQAPDPGYADERYGDKRYGDEGYGDEGYDVCPNCRSLHEPEARFCEVCGFDLVLMEHPGPPEPVPVQTTWDVVVEAEREYYDSGDDHRVPFPAAYPRRVFALNGPRLLIGRRSESRGIHPEIDLSGTPEDPGISRAHAMLELMPDGGYAVLDPGSTNGTRINDEPDPIPPGRAVLLHNGDRVYLGAWTRVTIRSR